MGLGEIREIVNQTVKSDRAIAPLLKTNNSDFLIFFFYRKHFRIRREMLRRVVVKAGKWKEKTKWLTLTKEEI